MPTYATSCQIQHGVLKITIRRVTIWRPFCFINPLSFAFPNHLHKPTAPVHIPWHGSAAPCVLPYFAQTDVDGVLAVGGGSVIDTAKAIAGGVLYHGDFWDFWAGRAVMTEALR